MWSEGVGFVGSCSEEIVDSFTVDGVDRNLVDNVSGSGQDQLYVQEHQKQVQIEELQQSHAHETECHYLNDSEADVVDGGEDAHVETGLLYQEGILLRGVDVHGQVGAAHHEHDQLWLIVPVLGQADHGYCWRRVLLLYLNPESEIPTRIYGYGIQSIHHRVDGQCRLRLVELQQLCIAHVCTALVIDSLIADQLDVVESLKADHRCKYNISHFLLGQYYIVHEYTDG